MGWRVDLLDYLQGISEEMGFDFFGIWKDQNNEETNDIFHINNALLYNLDFNGENILYSSNQDNFSLEKPAVSFFLYVCVKNKDYLLEKYREASLLCDNLEIRMMQQDSRFGKINFTGQNDVDSSNELVIIRQQYNVMVVETHEKINRPIPSQAGDITTIERNFCIKTT